jgi:hypothetical protein
MARVMRRQVLSMRGEPVDFGALAAQNPEQRTLGNTRMNVRGDILGDMGAILKTQEQVEAEWAKKREMAQRVQSPVNIKDVDSQVSPPSTKSPALAADIVFPSIADLVEQGVIPTTNTKRKIVDSDE